MYTITMLHYKVMNMQCNLSWATTLLGKAEWLGNPQERFPLLGASTSHVYSKFYHEIF